MPSIRLADLAQQLDAELHGDGDLVITDVASMQSAKAGTITFMVSPKYREQLAQCQARWQPAVTQFTRAAQHRVEQAQLRLGLLDPKLVLRRGYAWLQGEQGQPLTLAAEAEPGQSVTAILADGEVDLTVLQHRLD